MENPFTHVQQLDLPQEEYFQLDGYSSSDIRRLLKDRLNPWGVKQQRATPIEMTEAMLFGSALDTAVLEPHLFRRRYIFEEDFDRPTTDNQRDFVEAVLNGEDYVDAHARAYKNSSEATAQKLYESLEQYIALQKLLRDSDQLALPASFRDRLRGAKDAIMAHRRVLGIIEASEHQVVFTAEAFGVRWKGMLDMLRPGVVTDLKSTEDWYGRRGNFFLRGYNVQLTLYKWLGMATGMEVLFAESVHPHRVSLTDLNHQFGEEEIESWENTTIDLMKRIAHAHETDSWTKTREYDTEGGYEYI